MRTLATTEAQIEEVQKKERSMALYAYQTQAAAVLKVWRAHTPCAVDWGEGVQT